MSDYQNNNSFKEIISEGMKKKLEKLINPPEKPQEEIKRPKNNLWIANIAFNVLLAFIDFITAVTVAAFTLWFYGVLVFGAGYGPVLLWEFLYIRPYASKNQKIIAGIGAFLGALSTVGVGILVGVLNVIELNSLLGAGTIEMIVIISLIVLTSLHVLLFGLYYFTDLGFGRDQKFTTSLANHDETLRDVKMAKLIAKELIELGSDLENEVKQGRGGLVGAAMKKLGSTNILEDSIPELDDPERQKHF